MPTGRMTRSEELGQSRPSSGIEYPILAHSFRLERKASSFAVGAIRILINMRALRSRQQTGEVFTWPANKFRQPPLAIHWIVRCGAWVGEWPGPARVYGKFGRNSPLVAVGYRKFVVSVDCLPMGDRGRATFQAVAPALSLQKGLLTSLARAFLLMGVFRGIPCGCSPFSMGSHWRTAFPLLRATTLDEGH